jgi:hypothetical protein
MIKLAKVRALAWVLQILVNRRYFRSNSFEVIYNETCLYYYTLFHSPLQS